MAFNKGIDGLCVHANIETGFGFQGQFINMQTKFSFLTSRKTGKYKYTEQNTN